MLSSRPSTSRRRPDCEIGAEGGPEDGRAPARIRFGRRQVLAGTVLVGMAPLLWSCVPGRGPAEPTKPPTLTSSGDYEGGPGGNGYGNAAGAGGCGIIAWPDGADGSVTIGRRVPNFRLDSTDASLVSLSDRVVMARAPLVVNFFTSTCSGCQDELDVLQKALIAGNGVIGIDPKESAVAVQNLIGDRSIGYFMLLDIDGSVAAAYGATSLPMTFVLTRTGTLAATIDGAVTDDALSQALATAGAGG